MNSKFLKNVYFHGNNHENNLCIAFDSDHTKSRKELSVLHLNQTIHKNVNLKKKLFFYGKNQENNLCIAFDSKHTKRRKELHVLHLTQNIQKNQKRTLCASLDLNQT